MANESVYYPGSSTDHFGEDPVLGEINNIFLAGNLTGDADRGALRMPNVLLNKNQSFDFAGLFFDRALNNSGTWKVKIWGMKHPNVSTFNSGNPYGIYSKTTASVEIERSSPSQDHNINISSIVSEIIGQSSWASGNAMGFFVEDNGSSNNVYYDDAYNTSGPETPLIVRITDPNLTPTPETTAAPTFPASTDYGFKISKPGIDVKTATESQLYFTSRKRLFKIIDSADVSCSASVTKTVAHNLGYAPAVLAYAKSGGNRVKLNRFLGGQTDPVASGLEGFVGATTSELQIFVDTNTDVYYYIFIDPLT